MLALAAAAALAATTLVAVPASAASQPAGNPCPAPEVSDWYDRKERSVSVRLPASGCPSREQRRFGLSLRIERSDRYGSDGVDRTVICGPFRAGTDEVRYSCDVELALAHPAEEDAEYTVTLTYPDDDGEETDVSVTRCVSTRTRAECRDGEQENDILTGHGLPEI